MNVGLCSIYPFTLYIRSEHSKLGDAQRIEERGRVREYKDKPFSPLALHLLSNLLPREHLAEAANTGSTILLLQLPRWAVRGRSLLDLVLEEFNDDGRRHADTPTFEDFKTGADDTPRDVVGALKRRAG